MLFKNPFPVFFSIACALAAAHLWTGCSGKSIDETDPQALYNDADEDAKSHRYAIALDKLKTVKNKFPYSSFAKKAALRIADVHFENEEYIEAASAYETFRDLYPKYEKADYVIFRIGESYFNQLPSTADRDQAPATKAIEAYRELRQLYPKSEFAAPSERREGESLEKLADKEKYIADFYYKQEMYDSAAKRYEKIATKFEGTSFEEHAYYRWQTCLAKQGDRDGAQHVYDTYLARHPGGGYAKDMKATLEKKIEASRPGHEASEELK